MLYINSEIIALAKESVGCSLMPDNEGVYIDIPPLRAGVFLAYDGTARKCTSDGLEDLSSKEFKLFLYYLLKCFKSKNSKIYTILHVTSRYDALSYPQQSVLLTSLREGHYFELATYIYTGIRPVDAWMYKEHLILEYKEEQREIINLEENVPSWTFARDVLEANGIKIHITPPLDRAARDFWIKNVLSTSLSSFL